MGLVGGSRHYQGGGLGIEGAWACPSCGADNVGPITQGCTTCGAGKPGARVEATPPPPPLMPPRPQPEAPIARQGDIATWWAEQHPDVSVEEAYRAGYEDGVRAVRESMRKTQQEPRPPAGDKVTRTIVAALGFFADQVLAQMPQEIETGEWCSVDEVRALIEQLSKGAVRA